MRLGPIALAGLLALPLAARADEQTPPPASPRPEKKDKQAKPKKVYDNEDLKDAGKDGKGGAVTFLSEPEQKAEDGHAAASAPSSKDASSEDGRSSGSEDARPAAVEDTQAPGERQWRARAQEHGASVKNAQAEIAKLEVKLDALRAPHQQPQPIEALQPDPQRRLTKDEERVQLEKDLEAARAALADAQRALDDFLEEARRNNVPPGWVEER